MGISISILLTDFPGIWDGTAIDDSMSYVFQKLKIYTIMNSCNTTEQTKRQGRRGNRRRQAFIPHFGNIVNEILHTPLSAVLTDSPETLTRPASNIREEENAIIIELAIPGFSKSEVNLAIEKDLLTISANRKEDSELKFKLREFNYNNFKRSFRLSEKLSQESIVAEFKNGILLITLAKKEEEPAKTIEIK